MITIKHTNRAYIRRRVLLVVMIGCLCFSPGEGLRLTPFTLWELQQPTVNDVDVHEGAANKLTTGYNPAIVPTRTMKRSKQVVDSESQPPQGNRELIHEPRLPVTAEAINIIFLVLTSHIPSRAPPFKS